MSENILTTNSSPSFSAPDLDGRLEPTDTTVGRSDPIVVPKKFPLFSVLLLLILSVVSVICVYLFLQVRELSISQPVPSPSPSPIASADPMTGWQTYTNSNYNFSIQYPLGENIQVGEFKVDNSFEGFTILEIPDTSLISLRYQKTSVPVISWWKKLLGNEVDQKFATYNSDINFNGIRATEITFDKKGEYELSFNRVIIFSYNGANFEITVTNGNYDSEQTLRLDQILSTFKFIDSSTSYTCPASGYADCMPSPDGPKPSCSKEAMDWYKANCPDFKGAAL